MKKKLIVIVIIIGIVFLGLTLKNRNGKNENMGNTNFTETFKTKVNTEIDKDVENEKVEVPDIILKDQYGKEHRLKDYKGKVVFINFWATWCGYCVEELPYLEKLAKAYPNDVVVLGIAGPKSNLAPKNPDINKNEIIKFLERKKITYPILFDETGRIFTEYGIQFFPTSFIIGRDGFLAGYIPGGVTEENLRKIIDNAIEK